MDNDYNSFSSEFREFYYWCISNDTYALNARARNDNPFEVATGLSGHELDVAKNLLFEQMIISKSIFYALFLVELKDERAKPFIKQYLKEARYLYWCKHVDCREAIKKCKTSIKKLKMIDN